MKNSTQRTSCVHNSKKSDALSGIMQLSMAILFAFSITTQAEAIEYPSAKVQTAINQQSKIKITGTVVDQAGIPIIGANITVKTKPVPERSPISMAGSHWKSPPILPFQYPISDTRIRK